MPQGAQNRILSEMIESSLALARECGTQKPAMQQPSSADFWAAARAKPDFLSHQKEVTTRFRYISRAGLPTVRMEESKADLVSASQYRIGVHELCEPDYRQILILAKELAMEPEKVIRKCQINFSNGRITTLSFSFVQQLPSTLPSTLSELLCLETLNFVCCDDCGAELELADLPALKSFMYYGYPGMEQPLTSLRLSNLPKLERLWCECGELKDIGLFKLPELRTLICRWTQFLTKLDLSVYPLLTVLSCEGNELTGLDLSKVPHLEYLECHSNKITHLDLANTPKLKKLYCHGNNLSVLDVRPIINLEYLYYDIDKTRLIQRPDQKFQVSYNE